LLPTVRRKGGTKSYIETFRKIKKRIREGRKWKIKVENQRLRAGAGLKPGPYKGGILPRRHLWGAGVEQGSHDK
jgi:hypothetical protein